MPLTVSIIIPTFNRGGTIVRAVDSALGQTSKGCEVIVLDDGSTDDTALRLRPYSDRIRYVHQDNEGVAAARNRALQIATGDWVAFLDSDDIWLPDKLEKQFSALSAMGSDFGACFTDHIYVGGPCFTDQTCVGSSTATGSVLEQLGLKTSAKFGELRDSVHYIVRRGDQPRPIMIQSLLIRHSLIRELGGFDESLVLAEDTDFILRLSLKTRICFVPEVLLRVDRTPNTPRLTNHLSKKSDELFFSAEHLYKKWLSLPELVDPYARALIRERLRSMYYEWAIRELKNFRFDEALKRIRASGDSYAVAVSKLGARKWKKLLAGLARTIDVRFQGQAAE